MLLDSLLFLVKSLSQHIVIPSQTSVLDPFTCDFENFVYQTPYLGYRWWRVLFGKQGTARQIFSQAMIQIANSDMMTFTHMVAFTLPVALVMQ